MLHNFFLGCKGNDFALNNQNISVFSLVFHSVIRTADLRSKVGCTSEKLK